VVVVIVVVAVVVVVIIAAAVVVQGAAERTPIFEKRINSKTKKIREMFFYFWKEHRMPFYINVF